MAEFTARVDSLSGLVPFLILLAMLVWESFQPCFRFFVGRGGKRVRHGAINLLLGLLNALVIGFVFVGLWQGAVSWAEKAGFGVLRVFELPWWVEGLIAVLIFDFFTYWWHRFNHEIPFLWRFHRVHHSDPEMDVTTANRFHVGEIVLSSLLRVPLLILLGADMWQLALYEFLMFPVVQFHHANIQLPDAMERAFRTVFASPVMHKIHHSDDVKETNSNYTSFFSLWDRVFGSYRTREDFHMINLGLKEYREPEDQTALGILTTPVRKK